MTRKRLDNILRKEWKLIFTELNSSLMITLLPLLIVAQALFYIWLIARYGTEAIISNQILQAALEKLANALPSVASLPIEQQLQVLLLSQFNLFLLLIPTMVAINIAAFSIVEEKISRSLEPLLATPVRTWELLLGKALAGAIPALIVTWFYSLVFLAAVKMLGWGHLLPFVLTSSWFISLFLLTPAVAVLSFMLGVVGSSKAADAKSAQNIALVIIFPIMALVGVQVAGLVFFTPLLTLALALGVGLIDVIVLRIAVQLFQRESIVVKWH
ncbi:MAG: ABC transporter permease subunit [Chloroflexi bacterium]|nr:ABC transporter permease subunit [Chloroflexota bacterium]